MTGRDSTSGSAHKVETSASTVHSVGYPNQHLGHLTSQEEETFQNFKFYLQEKGLYKPGPPATHDDATLLRFLRARRWVIQDAYTQFHDTEEWRKANSLEALYNTIDLDVYEQSRQLYPQWTGRTDKRGIPIYLFEIKHLDSKTVSAYEKSAEKDPHLKDLPNDGKTPPKLIRLFALYENLTRFAQPLCTNLPERPYPETPITLSTNIVDVSGVSLRQFWNLKAHMQAASTLATAHYPETLDRIFILGAPMFFSTVWGWIKRWFDPITVSKIFIVGSHEVKSTLEEFIETRDIPKQYGGELEFSWGQMPNLDPLIVKTASWENGREAFPQGPVYWRPYGDGERLECVAVGTVGGKERLERVCTIPRLYKGQFVDAKVEEEVEEEVEEKAEPAVNGAAEVPDVAGLSLEEKSADGAAVEEAKTATA